ncbi:hypothetical protein [Massilia orientalis]|uniref:Uncharacterized protein n=1 Tax=Massilia orientalis TaxID=3050128 RepID=A0ACC7MDJ2_9BURK|nr:hypothetical protein [Massilia sp. YIM B02787]
MPFAENLAVVKDIVVVLGTLTTMSLGLYGLKVWKRDLVGKETYAVIRNVIKQLHKVSKAAGRARRKVHLHEHVRMAPEEAKHFTANEQWRLAEAAVYSARLDDLGASIAALDDSILEARILLGSSIHATTLVFHGAVREAIGRVNDYLDLLHDQHLSLAEDSPAIQSAQQAMYPSDDFGDELSLRIADARESAEIALLRYLHRRDIRGTVLKPNAAKAELEKWKRMTPHRRGD